MVLRKVNNQAKIQTQSHSESKVSSCNHFPCSRISSGSHCSQDNDLNLTPNLLSKLEHSLVPTTFAALVLQPQV